MGNYGKISLIYHQIHNLKRDGLGTLQTLNYFSAHFEGIDHVTFYKILINEDKANSCSENFKIKPAHEIMVLIT